MKEWYELVNDLETVEVPPDELAVRRVGKRIQSALPKSRSRWRIAAVVAALLALTACGVAAVRYSIWFQSVAADPARPEASEDLLASMGTSIHQSQTVDGVTATLHGAIHDGENLLLSLSVQGVQPVGRFDGSGESEHSWLFYSEETVADELRAYYPDLVQPVRITRPADPGAENVWLLLTPIVELVAGRELTLHLEQVVFGDLVLEGPYTFTFTPEVREVAQVYEGNVRLTLEDGTELTVTQVRITPLQVQVYCHGSLGGDGVPQLELEEVELRGGKTVWASGGGNRMEYDDDSWYGELHYGAYDRVVDPVLVTAVQINGTRLELGQLTLIKS